MNPQDLVPLDDDIRALLGSEKRAAPPADAGARVFAAVAGRIALPTPGGTGGTGGPSAGKGSGATAAAVGSTRVAQRIGTILGSFVLGGATATAIFLTRPSAPPVERIVYVDRVVQVASPPSATDPPVVPVSSLPVAASNAFVHSAPRASADPLSAERSLLDLARNGLATGESERALAAIARHEQQFPSGQLTEEREALGVKALVMAQRRDEARARADRFRQKFPRSVMIRSVESAVESMP